MSIKEKLKSAVNSAFFNLAFWPVVGWVVLQNWYVWNGAYKAYKQALKDNQHYRSMEQGCLQNGGGVECIHSIPKDRDAWSDMVLHAKNAYYIIWVDTLELFPIYRLLGGAVVFLLLVFVLYTLYKAFFQQTFNMNHGSQSTSTQYILLPSSVSRSDVMSDKATINELPSV